MKIRNGFVSNSSSGSFIITWQLPDNFESAPEYICNLFDVAYDPNIHNIKSDFGHDTLSSKYEDVAIYALDATSRVNDRIYESRAWTSMVNSIADFDHSFLAFVSALLLNGAKIIKTELDND